MQSALAPASATVSESRSPETAPAPARPSRRYLLDRPTMPPTETGPLPCRTAAEYTPGQIPESEMHPRTPHQKRTAEYCCRSRRPPPLPAATPASHPHASPCSQWNGEHTPLDLASSSPLPHPATFPAEHIHSADRARLSGPSQHPPALRAAQSPAAHQHSCPPTRPTTPALRDAPTRKAPALPLGRR